MLAAAIHLRAKILAYVCYWEDKFWAGSFSLLCLVFDQLGIKQNNRQRIFIYSGYLTNKTHAGRGFQKLVYSLFYCQKLYTEILNEKSGRVKHSSTIWGLLHFAWKIIFKIGPDGLFSQSSVLHYSEGKK